mgnify:CR=1 FL=1
MKTYIIIVVSVLLFGLKLFAGEPVKKFPDNLVTHIDGIQSYPNDAKNYGIQGFVDVVFKVDKNGELKVKESKRLRLGAFRYGLNLQDLAIIALAAPVSTILLMLIIKPIF